MINKLDKEERKAKEDELVRVFEGDLDMATYLTQNNFDPVQEILKEKNIKNFFKQKYNILMMYLEGNEEGQNNNKKSNKRFSTSSNQNLNNQNVKNPLESTKTEIIFTSAQEKVKAIEDEISIELNKDWEEKDKINKEKQEIEQNIKMFYEKLLLQKKRVQTFVDPRSTKFRKSYKVVNEHINNIRKVDPNLSLGKKRTKQNKNEQKRDKVTNVEILAEILKETQNSSYSKPCSAPVKSKISERLASADESDK